MLNEIDIPKSENVPKKNRYPRERIKRIKGLARPFFSQFSISLGLGNVKFREEFEYGIYTSIQTIFNASTEAPFFFP